MTRNKPGLKASDFVQELNKHQSDAELKKILRYFRTGEGDYGEGDKFMGVRMATIFALAKKFIAMTVPEISKLLDNPIHEVRVGAVSIMDFQARDRKTTDDHKKELFNLYIGRHDRINNWDLVDRSAPFVVGGYLFDKPRKILYKLARSKDMWERRTSIVCTWYFIRQGQVDDTYKIAEILMNEKQDIIHKAIGSWLREAGKRDNKKLLSFLEKYAPKMPRVTLRYAIEHLDKKKRQHYLNL